MPGDVKEECDRGWIKELKDSPELRECRDQNKWKFDHCDMTRIVQIIRYGANWEREDGGGFSTIFPCDKIELEKRVILVKAGRDPKQHIRDSTSQVALNAASELRWFSKVLGDNTLNPYIK